MTESNATRLANVINYFNEGFQDEIWQAEIHPYMGKEWKIVVREKSAAYKHELNALMMVIQSTMFTSCNQVGVDEGEIIGKIW